MLAFINKEDDWSATYNRLYVWIIISNAILYMTISFFAFLLKLIKSCCKRKTDINSSSVVNINQAQQESMDNLNFCSIRKSNAKNLSHVQIGKTPSHLSNRKLINSKAKNFLKKNKEIVNRPVYKTSDRDNQLVSERLFNKLNKQVIKFNTC